MNFFVGNKNTASPNFNYEIPSSEKKENSTIEGVANFVKEEKPYYFSIRTIKNTGNSVWKCIKSTCEAIYTIFLRILNPISGNQETTTSVDKSNDHLHASKANPDLQKSIDNVNSSPLDQIEIEEQRVADSVSSEIIENTASKIDRFAENVFNAIKDQKETPLRSWILSNHKNYVAHAICTSENVKNILISKTLTSAQAILRRAKIVEFEQSDIGSRGIERLPTLSPEEIQSLKEIENKFSDYRGKALGFGIVPMEVTYKTEDEYYLHDFTEDLPEDQEFPFTLYKLSNLDSVTELDYFNKLQDIAEAHKCSVMAAAIAYDESKPEELRIDTLLAKAYSNFAEKIKASKFLKKYMVNSFITARERVIPLTKLNNEIRVLKNKIDWECGDTVVLSGNAKEMICQKLPGKERCLLAPWQNGGKHLDIDLTDPKTFVLGPKSELEKYADELNLNHVRFQYIEDLTQAECDYFNVPKKLRP